MDYRLNISISCVVTSIIDGSSNGIDQSTSSFLGQSHGDEYPKVLQDIVVAVMEMLMSL